MYDFFYFTYHTIKQMESAALFQSPVLRRQIYLINYNWSINKKTRLVKKKNNNSFIYKIKKYIEHNSKIMHVFKKYKYHVLLQ